MPAKQDDGRIAIAMLAAAQPLHLAWGEGDPAWDHTPEAEPTNATGLVAEIGRRTVTQVGFVTPDPAGQIETPQGNYTLSETPTRYLYVRTAFSFSDAETAHIREVGLFIGTELVPGLPHGQHYFTPDQVASPGRLLLLDRTQNFPRNGAARPGFEYVLPF